MTSILRRFRGLGIALAVLAISAGAVFAAAPPFQLTSHAAGQAKTQVGALPDASESAEPSDSASPEPSESAEPSESPEASASPEPLASPEASGSQADNHGALVSTAAQMPTPSGFPNHGAFVSCVAHMDVSALGFDWKTVTPESCGITTTSPTAKTNHASSNGASHSAAGQTKAAAAKASHGRGGN
jgi:hypothetical protein